MREAARLVLLKAGGGRERRVSLNIVQAETANHTGFALTLQRHVRSWPAVGLGNRCARLDDIGDEVMQVRNSWLLPKGTGLTKDCTTDPYRMLRQLPRPCASPTGGWWLCWENRVNNGQ